MKKIFKILILVLSLITLASVALCSCTVPATAAKEITSIQKTSTEGKVDTYTIYYSNGETYTFTITNGTDGKDGVDGIDGVDGTDGTDGKDGINGTNGKDGVDGTDGKDGINGTNGKDGVDGTDGKDGKDGVTPTFKLEENELFVSYDGGENWTSLGKITATEQPENPEQPEEPVIPDPIVIEASDIRNGGYSYGAQNSKSNRISYKELIEVKAGTVITYSSGSIKLMFNVVSGEDATSYITQGSWVVGENATYTVTEGGYLAIIGANIDTGTNITKEAWDAEISIQLPAESTEPPVEYEAVYSERKIYEFGGEGNDYCFVYLPLDYDPERAEPYPFVIANHGNGWTMTGSAERANYTDITMYLSASAIANKDASKQARFIATENPNLWYLNPTIVAYLEAGYIVCGAQNYGDNLYGNANCRDACVDFYNHMQETYNVTEKCTMIGASNGCMTTLNAVSVLGEKVSAIILQYPLSCLSNHYFAGKHQTQIRQAYGITDANISLEDFKTATEGFDPLYTNVVDGKKVGYFPATRIYYSTTDTTTPSSANAEPLIALLAASDVNVVSIQVDSDGEDRNHGHVDHFAPDEFVAWSEANK